MAVAGRGAGSQGGVVRPRPWQGDARGLRRGLDRGASWPAAPYRRSLQFPSQEPHRPLSGRGAAGQAFHGHDPPVASGTARQRRLGVHDGEGVSAVVRGAADENAGERPVLTVAQVFELADLVGLRPVGNIRGVAGGGYRVRFQCHGEMRTVPQVYATRAEAEKALWVMAWRGKADRHHDRRYRALVLLATFASL